MCFLPIVDTVGGVAGASNLLKTIRKKSTAPFTWGCPFWQTLLAQRWITSLIPAEQVDYRSVSAHHAGMDLSEHCCPSMGRLDEIDNLFISISSAERLENVSSLMCFEILLDWMADQTHLCWYPPAHRSIWVARLDLSEKWGDRMKGASSF